MATCKYETCSATGHVDDEGACPKCAELAAKMRDRIVQGMMVRYQRQGHPDRVTREAEKFCVACDTQITEETHWASGEHHLHEVCHEIWMKG